jgi:hypothetical protein
MEEKQPVVIQGRPIHRERSTSPRDYSLLRSYNRPAYSRRVNTGSGNYSSVSLSSLRESRRMGGGASSISDRPRVRPRTRRSSYPYSGRLSKQDGLQLNSLMTKIAISVLIALIIFLLNSIKLPFTEAAVNYVRTALTHEFDLDEALGKLKFVGESIPDEFQAVFGRKTDRQSTGREKEGFRSPVQGEVVRAFGEQVILEPSGKAYENQGIDIRTAVQASVYSAQDGTVAAVEQHEIYGSSIWVDHGNKVFSFYGRCGQINVKTGQKVKQGEKLGLVATPSEGNPPLLHFQIWVDDAPVDPLNYISHADKSFDRRGVQSA